MITFTTDNTLTYPARDWTYTYPQPTVIPQPVYITYPVYINWGPTPDLDRLKARIFDLESEVEELKRKLAALENR